MRLLRTMRFCLGNRLPAPEICFPVILLLAFGLGPASAQSAPEAEYLADAVLQSGSPANGAWSEETAMQLEGLEAAWYDTAKGDYFRTARARVDAVLETTTSPAMSTFESGLLGRQFLLMYRVTLAPKYYTAAAAIRAQLASVCDTEGGTDKVCTSEPFLAEYASVFQEPQEFAKLARDFARWDRSAHWPSNAGKDEGREQHDKSIAWFAAALVDALPYFPENDPSRSELIALLKRISTTAAQHQNKSTGLFEKSGGGPLPPSQTGLLAYALAKGARRGYLPAEDSRLALDAWKAIEKSYLNGGSNNEEPRPSSGILLRAAAELDLAPTATSARGETVLVDAWFNSQQRKNAAGQMESFHYKWDDMADSGYSLLGHMFRSYGATTKALDSAPTRESLSAAQYYLIASPDIPVKNPNPHYMNPQDADQIAAWVKDGGVLVLLENDPPNADISHLNLLADHFGIHFDDVLHHHILGEQVEDGRIPVEASGPLFHQSHTLYMKDTCAISLREPAVALLRDRGDVVMATVKYGRGTVFAAVDPWLYNEYTDGRKNPHIYSQFDNFAGGRELVQWLLQQHPH